MTVPPWDGVVAPLASSGTWLRLGGGYVVITAREQNVEMNGNGGRNGDRGPVFFVVGPAPWGRCGRL
jgi:hypothetical protein